MVLKCVYKKRSRSHSRATESIRTPFEDLRHKEGCSTRLAVYHHIVPKHSHTKNSDWILQRGSKPSDASTRRYHST